MSAIVFGEVDPRQYVVPEYECMACRHPVMEHEASGRDEPGCLHVTVVNDAAGALRSASVCRCRRSLCWLHDALDEEHDCDSEGEL